MIQIVNNRNVTTLNSTLLIIAIVTSIAWLIDLEKIQIINSTCFGLLSLFTFVHIVANSQLISDKHYYSIIICFVILQGLGALLPHFVEFNSIATSLSMILIGSIGMLVTYIIRYKNKSEKRLLDKLKMFWVALSTICGLLSYILQIQHWPYQELISNIDLIAYVPMVFTFYYLGIKNGDLLKKN